ncbi:MAG TPA: DUF3185 domain-containing protein [Gemmataceae bacterium]|jgi:hypothetical protein|nr:DUF3185 domain-containing protein [Gemmataceae bacterium]
MKAIGVLLIVLGVIGLAYGGLTWTTREKVVDLGPVEVTQNKTKSLPLPPIAGGICLVAGVILLVGPGRRR